MRLSFQAIAEILNLQNDKKPLIGCILSSQIIEDVIRTIKSYDSRIIVLHEKDKIKEKLQSVKSILVTEKVLLSNDNCIKTNILDVVKELGISTTIYLESNTDISKNRNKLLQYLKENESIIIGNNLVINTLIQGKSECDNDKDNSDMDEEKEFINRVKKFARKNNVVIMVLGKRQYLTNGYSEFFISNTIMYEDINSTLGPIIAGLVSTSASLFTNPNSKLKYILLTTIFFNKCILNVQKKNTIFSNKIDIFRELLINEIEINKQKRYELDIPVIYKFVSQ